jgi:hypothetical protein
MDNDAPTDASTAPDDLVTGAPSTTDAQVPDDTDARPLPDDEQDSDAPHAAPDRQPYPPPTG